MIAHVGVALATYLGLRLIDALDEKVSAPKSLQRTRRLSLKKAEEASKIDLLEKSSDMREQAVSPDIRKTLTLLEHRHQHFAHMSMVATGLVLVRNVILGVIPIAGVTYLYALIPQLKSAKRSLVDDGRLGTDGAFLSLNMFTLALGLHGSTTFSLWALHSAKAMHIRARAKLYDDANKYFSAQKNTVWIIKEGIELEVQVAQVMEGDLVVVSDGTTIPFSGIVCEGAISVNQYLLTGQTEITKKKINATVYANTVVVSGNAVIQVDSSKNYI